MKYDNQKSLTELIDKIVLSESEELAKKVESLNLQIGTYRDELKEKDKRIKNLRDSNEVMSRNIDIIRKYEEITWRYFVANPQVEDVSWQWDIEIVWIDVDEVTKEYKYPTELPTKQSEQPTQSDDLPF